MRAAGATLPRTQMPAQGANVLAAAGPRAPGPLARSADLAKPVPTLAD